MNNLQSDNKKLRIAAFVGSFDPFTCGHEDIVIRALNIFDKIIIVVGENSNKKTLFSLQKRIDIIEKVFAENKNVSVTSYSGLTVDFCKEKNIKFIVRGLRTHNDYEAEQILDMTNKSLLQEVETVILFSKLSHLTISSTAFREIWKYKGNVSNFLPSNISLSDFCE